MASLLALPKELHISLLTQYPFLCISYSLVNRAMRAISLEAFQKADRTILAIFPTFSKIDPQQISADKSATRLFMKLVNRLHDEAKDLGCDQVHNTANPIDRTNWECAHFEELIQKVKSQMELAKTQDFNTFVTQVAKAIPADIPAGIVQDRDLREFWENTLLLDPKTKQITALNLFSKGLKYLPREIACLTNLRNLYLGSNRLNGIPPECASLSQLELLDLSQNKLEDFPKLPPSLKQLRLGGNKLNNLPSDLQLPALESLDISHNSLTTFPSAIPALLQLKILYLSHADMVQLPDPLVLPPKLVELYLTANKLAEISESAIASLSSLRKLYLYENPLSAESVKRLFSLRESSRGKEIRWFKEETYHLGE